MSSSARPVMTRCLLPGLAVVTDDGDDRSVTEAGHDQLDELTGGLPGVQGGDQRLADLGEEPQPVGVRVGGAARHLGSVVGAGRRRSRPVDGTDVQLQQVVGSRGGRLEPAPGRRVEAPPRQRRVGRPSTNLKVRHPESARE
jgi:hypothetical protein